MSYHKDATKTLKIESKAYYYTTPITFGTSGAKAVKSYIESVFKRDVKINIQPDGLKNLFEINPFLNRFHKTYVWAKLQKFQNHIKKKRTPLMWKNIDPRHKAMFDNRPILKEKDKNNFYKQNIYNESKIIHLFKTKNPTLITFERLFELDKTLVAKPNNITDDDISNEPFSAKITKSVDVYENLIKSVRPTYTKIQRIKTDGLLLYFIKYFMLKVARFFVCLKYIYLSVKEINKTVEMEINYFIHLYWYKIHISKIAQLSLVIASPIDSLKKLNVWDLKIIGNLFENFNKAPINFSFWCTMWSWIIMYIVNCIHKIYWYLPYYNEVLNLFSNKHLFNKGYNVSLFQFFNIYKEMFIFRFFSSNVFLQLVYNYCSFTYISLIQFFKIDFFKLIMFDWEQKWMTLTNAFTQWHSEPFWLDHEAGFFQYQFDLVSKLLTGGFAYVQSVFLRCWGKLWEHIHLNLLKW